MAQNKGFCPTINITRAAYHWAPTGKDTCVVRIFFISLTMITALLNGCSSTTPEKVNYPYQPQGIELFVSAPNNLNYDEKQAHALTLGVIQTDQADTLYPSLQSTDGIVNLLLNSDNKLMLQRLFIQPDTQRTIHIDRNAKTQQLILIAGYSDLLPAQSSQAIKIPIEKNSSGFLWLHKSYDATTLYIYLDLGPQGIVAVRACDEPLKPNKQCSQNLIEKTT